MHLKMDSWHSDWLGEENINRDLTTPNDSTQLNTRLYSFDYSIDSPNFSRDDSVESGGDETVDKSDTNILKPTFKSVLQAKKRLQAFSAAKQLKRTGSKDEKAEEGDKGDKTSPKKLPRKGEYPGDKAKAVIQEIEEIKRSEAKEAKEEQEKHDALIAHALRTYAMNRTSRSRSLSPDREKRFKRREIKSRNYRRTDSFNRKSPSPDNHSRRSNRSPPRKSIYPKNWTQYKQLNLTVVKDEELKLKLFPKQKYSQHELVSRFINFSSPSPLIESFKCFSLEEKYENIPLSFMRVTRSRPPLIYSVNKKKNKESFITRNQLFQIISKDRRNAIENLINTPSRCQPNNKVLNSRQWYSKSWKKTSDAECKVIENSVGLSFLQNYSDEEEEIETEEILICSSTKEADVKKTVRPDVVIDTKKSNITELLHSAKEIVIVSRPQVEKAISIDSNVTEEQIAAQTEKREKREEKSEETKRLLTEEQIVGQTEKREKKEEKSEEVKRLQQDELKQTRKAIRELEEELERRKALKTEEEAKERRKIKKRRKKKVKKKQESFDVEEKDSPKKKKKRKNKSKKKKYIEEESCSSEDEKRKKKKNGKTAKYKKDKTKKKKEKSKREETPAKEHKVKKKDEDTEESNLKEENKKRRRKSSNNDQPNSEDNNKPTDLEAPKKKNKKKKKDKLDNEKESLKNAEIPMQEEKNKHNESEENLNVPIENSGKKKRKTNRWGSIEPENVVDETFQFYGFEKANRSSISKTKDYEEVDHKSDPKQSTSEVDRNHSTSEVDRNRSTSIEKANILKKDLKRLSDEQVARNRSRSREEPSKVEKDLKRFYEDHAGKNKDHESLIFERESRNTKEKIQKPEENAKAKHVFEEAIFNDFDFIKKSSEKIEGGLIKKHTEKGKQKVDLERNKNYSEKSEKSEKRETDGKSNKDRRNSDTFEKSGRKSDMFEKKENQIERDISKDKHQKEKLEKHQKEKGHSEGHPQKDKIIIKKEPDWEILRNKRKRHRNTDSKEANKDLVVNKDKPDDFEGFPLEKEILSCKEKDRHQIPNKRSKDECKRDTGTPDTDDYRENWEKDIFPIWESEDEAPPKPREKLNNSWESDEEVFERGQCAVESARPLKETFDLEIPLNIKPFKRREVIDSDTELQFLKRESQTLSEERRRLEIEKLRVKELELKVIREVENKVKDQYKSKVVKEVDHKVKEDYKSKVVRDLGSKLKEDLCKSTVAGENKVKEDQYKSKVVRELESKVLEDQLKPNIREAEDTSRKDETALIDIESEVTTDQHKPSLVQIGNDENINSRNLDQEKFEVKKGRWDKKLTQPRISTPKADIAISKVKKEIVDEEDSLTNVSSSTSLNNNSAVLENEYEEFMKAVSSSTSQKKKKVRSRSEISSLESSSFESSDSESSSKNLQANKKPRNNKDPGGQNFVFKNIITNLDELIPVPLDAPSEQSVMILPKDIPLIPMPLPQTEVKPVPVPSPTIDVDKIRKPLFNLGISANITLDISSKLAIPGADSPSGKSLEFINPPLASSSVTDSPKIKKLEEIVPLRKPDTIINFASPLTDVSLDSVLFDEKPRERDDTRLNDKPFVFTSMVLPSKRPLLNNSNLNLGDSEDEEVNAAKSMKKLEEIMKENLTDSAKVVEKKKKVEVHVEKTDDINSSKGVTNAIMEKKDTDRSRSPVSNRNDSKRRSSEKVMKRDVSTNRMSIVRRAPSPRRRVRELSPKRRGFSPRRQQSPRRRSPPRRRSSPVKRKYSPRRSISPRGRRRSSISPPRKLSPHGSTSPKRQASLPKKMQSRSPEKPKSALAPYKLTEKPVIESNKRKSPITITSPLEGLKRSVADSTISDDLLPQPSANLEEYAESPVSRFYNRTVKPIDSPKRVPLDIRINQVLGLTKEEPKPITTIYSNYNYEHSQYHQQFNQVQAQKSNVPPVQKIKVPMKQTKGSFVQVGNMVQIVPTEDIPIIEPSKIPVPPLPSAPPQEKPVAIHKKKKKSQIVQVGNMLQIVPTDMLPDVPLPPDPKPPKLKLLEPKIEVNESIPESFGLVQEKQSAETSMRLKVAERRAERDKRRQERERRRKEKEKRRKEKEKQRQIKLKQRTENMIKKALQLEVEGVEEEEEEPVLNETPAQWPPLPVIVSSVSKEVGKSILIKGGQSKNNVSRSDKTKIVQFADGVRPGEGTSPSGGEELSSPPPASKKLPKEKRYKKTKLFKKNPKKKVKVKIIKKRSETEDSDEEDNLPPPSPPPGSPPPHLFPPRIKTHTINNIHTYIPNVVPIQASHNQQLYGPQLNLVMHPPHPPHHHGPPPPPHHGHPPHHGPPHHGPPHHGPPHHGPPHHGPPPPHHHHGPPGPPHFHHGPPPPPGPHHHHGPPGHHHHGPPPYHH